MNYTIKRFPNGIGLYVFDGNFDPERLDAPWSETEQADILDYCWLNEYPDHFFAVARAGADEEGLNVLMYSNETPITANEKHFGGMQCMDSCMEFFLCPFPEDSDRYLNIELNPLGTAHVGVGEGRHGRKIYDGPVADMKIKVFHNAEYWAVSFNIPNSLFIREFGKAPVSGQKMKGNFYKCSGPSLHEHYGCWNHVTAPHPDFHRPECFGNITIE